MYCENCGTKFEKDDQFCVTCGARRGELLKDYTPEGTGAAARPKRKRKTGIVFGILGILLVCGACAGVGWYVLQNSSVGSVKTAHSKKESTEKIRVIEETGKQTISKATLEANAAVRAEEEYWDNLLEADAATIASAVLQMEQMDMPSMNQRYFNDEQGEIRLTTVSQPTVICAERYDFDLDGSEEILACAILAGKYTPIGFYMLELSEDRWSLVSEVYPARTNVPLAIYDGSVTSEAIRIFWKEGYNGLPMICLEEIGNKYGFSEEFLWGFYTYSYQDGYFYEAMSPMLIDGSYDTYDIYVNGVSLESDEAIMMFAPWFEGMYMNGFDPDMINMEESITAEDSAVHHILWIDREDSLSTEEIALLEEGGVDESQAIGNVETNFTVYTIS